MNQVLPYNSSAPQFQSLNSTCPVVLIGPTCSGDSACSLRAWKAVHQEIVEPAATVSA